MTNYEKYFGTPETAADSIAGANNFAEAWDEWTENDGALICAITPSRGNNKTKRQAEAFRAFLEADAKGQS